jgi:hypothetical protein
MMKRPKVNTQLEKKIKEILKDLDSYIKFRRNKEGIMNGLDMDFYVRHYNDGVRSFCGVTVDEEVGLVEDTQNPVAFHQYKSLKSSYQKGTR